MDFKEFRQKTLAELPPSLVNGDKLDSITGVKLYTYTNKGETIQAMNVFADGKTFKTTSKVIMEILNTYFATNKEPLQNVRVEAPRGKRYLTLVGSA